MKKILVVMLAVALCGVFSSAVLAEEEGPKYGKKVGDIAAPVVLKDFGGADVDTGKLSNDGKVMYVFVNAVCSLCRREMNALMNHADKFNEKADVYLVAVDMDPARAEKVYSKFADKFKLLHDPEFKLGEALNVYSTPATAILDKGNKIVMTSSGFQKDSLKKYMENL